MLQEECRNAGVEMRTNCRVGNITKTDRFHISTKSARVEAGSLVVATGGLSHPELGATDMGFRTAARFGLKVKRLRPSLVPLVFGPDDFEKFSELSGVSFDAMVNCRARRFRGETLHTGLADLHWVSLHRITVDCADMDV
jgi:predicted flavoprotein YhiN